MIETPDGNLSQGMRQLNDVFTQRFNQQHQRVGMVFKAENWQWSSYRNMVGLDEPPIWLQVNWLLSCFGKCRLSAIEKYKVFVAEGKGQLSPWPLLKKQIFLGNDHFVEEMEAKVDKDQYLSEIPSSQR